MTEPTKIHGNTKKAADMSLARREISPQSHAAIMEGRITLEAARELGRDRGPDAPPQPSSRISKGDRSRECMCGCGERTAGGRFRMGHDMRLHTYAKEYLRGERELRPRTA